MKNTYEQMIVKVAKSLIRDFKSDPKGTTIHIKGAFSWIGCNDGTGYYYRHDDPKSNLYFGNLDDEGFAKLTRDVASEIDKRLKLPKKMLKHKDEKEYSKWCGWSSYKYTMVKKFVILTPCKSFVAINKKLGKLGLKPIPFADWFHGEVAGKREDIFSVEHNYYCLNEKKCDEVLSFLMGRKKLTYEITRVEDFQDRDYGIEHETEWYGHLYYRLKFTDSKGKSVMI